MTAGAIKMSNELEPVYKELGSLRSDVGNLSDRLDHHMGDSKTSSKEVSSQLQEINKHVLSLNSVDRKLRDVGLDLANRGEHQKDMAYVRKMREKSDSRSVWVERIIITIIITAALGFLGTALFNQVVKKLEEAQIQAPVPTQTSP